MKQPTRFAALLLALAMLLSLSAFASGEASGSEEFNTAASTSGEAESTAIFTVADGEVTVRDGADYALSGEIGGSSASGIDLTVNEFTASGIQVTGGAKKVDLEGAELMQTLRRIAGQ